MRSSKKNFKPEFLNRVDEVIVFPQLTREELMQIVDLFIGRLQQRLDERDLKLVLTTAAKERLIELGYEPSLGARPFAGLCSAKSRTRYQSVSSLETSRAPGHQGRLRLRCLHLRDNQPRAEAVKK